MKEIKQIKPRIKKKYFHLRQEASLNNMLNGNCDNRVGEVIDKALVALEKRFPSLDALYVTARGF